MKFIRVKRCREEVPADVISLPLQTRLKRSRTNSVSNTNKNSDNNTEVQASDNQAVNELNLNSGAHKYRRVGTVTSCNTQFLHSKRLKRRLSRLEHTTDGGSILSHSNTDESTDACFARSESHSDANFHQNGEQIDQRTKSILPTSNKRAKHISKARVYDINWTHSRCEQTWRPAAPQHMRFTAQSHHIMDPFEQELDKMVWLGFQSHSNYSKKVDYDARPTWVSRITQLIALHPELVNFQRPLADGTTPLMTAASNGDKVMVDWLVKMKADVSCIDANGFSAADHAFFQGFKEIATDLQDKEQNQNKPKWIARCKPLNHLQTFSTETNDLPENNEYLYDIYVLEPKNHRCTTGTDNRIHSMRNVYQPVSQQQVEMEQATWTFSDDEYLSEDDFSVGTVDSSSVFDDSDSNDEDYFANEYPEEPDDSSIDEVDNFNDLYGSVDSYDEKYM